MRFPGARGEALRAFGLTLGLAIALWGVLVTHARREVRAITMREGIAITGLGWCIGAGLGMLPYVLGGCLGFLDGFFESLSGFMGTGTTVITSLSEMPRSLLFWRSMTHWFGGLGIIVIFIALLPQAGQSTAYMYNAETTGPTHDRVMPRLQSMTGALFRLYAGLTLAAAVIYWLCGMDAVTAANHALSTLGNVGPAFGIAGATCTFAPLPAGMKALLCFEMLLGRLEIFTLLAMLQPAFWRTKHPW